MSVKSVQSVGPSLLPLPPFVRLLLPRVRVDLVPHAPKDVGGGLSGHDEGLDHGGGDLSQDPPHRPRHPPLLVLAGRRVVDGQRRVRDPLETHAANVTTVTAATSVIRGVIFFSDCLFTSFTTV